jgi:hypothetical protein
LSSTDEFELDLGRKRKIEPRVAAEFGTRKKKKQKGN